MKKIIIICIFCFLIFGCTDQFDSSIKKIELEKKKSVEVDCNIIIPSFESYSCYRPDIFIFKMFKGDIVDYRKVIIDGLSTNKTYTIGNVSFYRTYDFSKVSSQNLSNAVGGNGDEKKSIYTDWVKKITWYKIWRFKYIKIEEGFCRQLPLTSIKNFDDLYMYSDSYKAFRDLGFTDIQITKPPYYHDYYMYVEYMLECPKGYDVYIKCTNNWLFGDSFNVIPLNDYN